MFSLLLKILVNQRHNSAFLSNNLKAVVAIAKSPLRLVAQSSTTHLDICEPRN